MGSLLEGNKMLENLFKLCDGIAYTRSIPKEAVKYAEDNGFIVIVGGSDDLMYAYGAKSYLTDVVEHGYGWDGSDLSDIDDERLEFEAKQLGLKILWCGEIDGKVIIENYDHTKLGAFSYQVKEGVEFKNFTVFEDEKRDEVYCTGIIIKLPNYFKIWKKK